MNTNDSRSKGYFSRIQPLNAKALQYTEQLHIFDSAIIGIELNSKDKYVLTFSVHKMFKIASKMGVRHNSVRMFIKKCIPKDLLTNEHSPLFRYADHRDMIGRQLMVQQNLFDYDLLVSNYCDSLCFQRDHNESCDCICHTFTCPKCKCTLNSNVRLFTCPSCSFGFTPDENNKMKLIIDGFDYLKDYYIKSWPDLFTESKELKEISYPSDINKI